MIDLLDIPGRKADLISIRAVALSGTSGQILLGQLAFQRLSGRNRGVGSTGHTHGLVHISPA